MTKFEFEHMNVKDRDDERPIGIGANIFFGFMALMLIAGIAGSKASPRDKVAIGHQFARCEDRMTSSQNWSAFKLYDCMRAAGYDIRRVTYNKGKADEFVCDPDTGIPTGAEYEQCYKPMSWLARWRG